MKKYLIMFLVYGVWSIVHNPEIHAQRDIGNYLIVEPINGYEEGTANLISNSNGILAPTGHFEEHIDTTYSIPYYSESIDIAVEVSDTKHAAMELLLFCYTFPLAILLTDSEERYLFSVDFLSSVYQACSLLFQILFMNF